MASATPVAHSISRRNPCDGKDASPVLYHEYRGDKCPPKATINDDGVCDHTNFQTNDCAAFCEIRTNFVYGREQPFANTYCHGPQSCTITSTHTKSVAWTVSVTPKFLEGLKWGVTGGYNENSADAFARAYSVKLDEGSCGYFTFVPVVKDVCGTMSYQSVEQVVPPIGLGCADDMKTIGNYCQSQLRRNDDGSADGETIFVKTDCGNRMPLPMDKQDPVYQKPGVALDRGVYQAYADAWGNTEITTNSDDEVKCETSDGSPDMTDCTHAFAGLLNNPGNQVLHGKKDGTWWASYVMSCAIAINYNEDWDDSCDFTLADVAVSAYTITDQCTDTGLNKAGGKRTFGSGKCASHVEIINTSGQQPPSGGL